MSSRHMGEATRETNSQAVRHADVECIVCGYDLRNNPAGVCPECGIARGERDRLLAQQGGSDHRQSQAMLLALGWLVILTFALSMLAGLMQMILGGRE